MAKKYISYWVIVLQKKSMFFPLIIISVLTILYAAFHVPNKTHLHLLFKNVI